VGLERGPLSLETTIEELLERKSSGSGLGNREYGSSDPSRWPRGTLYPKLPFTCPVPLVSISHAISDMNHNVWASWYSNGSISSAKG
jgi:hypothetical protein